jgi:hypothetical protein
VINVSVDAASNRFRAVVPQGEYAIAQGGYRRTMTLLPGGLYQLDLRGGIDLNLSQSTAKDGTVALSVTAHGTGAHTLAVRSNNIDFGQAERQIVLKSGVPQTVVLKGKLTSISAPWVAVVYPDGDLSRRKEATGATR